MLWRNFTCDMCDHCRPTVLLYVVTTLCQYPEDGSCAEKCGNKLIVKYVIYRIVHFLELIEFDEGKVKKMWTEPALNRF
jgi:hypothetical protein